MHKIAKDMSYVYSLITTEALIRNRHKKQVALYRLHGQTGYWAKKECARLNHMLAQLDAELAARAAQEPLF